jgi:hypothetical protein
MTDRFKELLNRLEPFFSPTHPPFQDAAKFIWCNSDDLKKALTLATEAEQLRYDLEFVWKCVERAKWNPKIFGKPETAIENMVLYPNAPWNNKERWNWDTSHKNYDSEIKNYVAENEQLRDAVRQLELACQIHKHTEEQLRKERDDFAKFICGHGFDSHAETAIIKERAKRIIENDL